MVPIKLPMTVAKLLRLMARREWRSARRQFMLCVAESMAARGITASDVLSGADIYYTVTNPPKIPESNRFVAICRIGTSIMKIIEAMARVEGRTIRNQIAICVLESARQRGINIPLAIENDKCIYVPVPPPEPIVELED